MNNARSPTPNVGFLNTMTNTAVNAVNNVAEAIENTVTNNVGNIFKTNNFKANNFKANNLNLGFNMGNVKANSGDLFGMSWLQIITSIVVIAIFTLIAIFYNEIITFFEGLVHPSPPTPETPPMTAPPMSQEDSKIPHMSSVEKILPGRKEVFNISANNYTYYDAQALCKSLGSELATYDQVKEAYDQGADWCNYGWTEGQMAVYPTQEGSWKKLQEGPEDQRTSCGRPGLNGGYFDNPELQFGVNCHGIKPSQSKHDASAIAAGASAPLSPEAIALEKKVAAYRGKDTPIMPFSSSKWAQ